MAATAPTIGRIITEQRSEQRMKVPAMYTLMRARPVGAERYCWTGYVYDISLSGMRFELDQPVENGTEIEFRAMLPGHSQVLFRAVGRVVRLHGDGPEAGPVRMGMTFERFTSIIDQRRLRDYLADHLQAEQTVRQAA